MTKVKNVSEKMSTALASLALNAALSSTATMCWFVFHQPKEPQALKALKNK